MFTPERRVRYGWWSIVLAWVWLTLVAVLMPSGELRPVSERERRWRVRWRLPLPPIMGGTALFWVGGTGSWDGTTNHFATTTGGAASVASPGAADTVTFDSNSGTGTVTATVVGGYSVAAVTVNSANITLTHNVSSTVSGAMTLTTGTLNTGAQTCVWGSFVGTGAVARTLTITNSNITVTANSAAWSCAATTSMTLNAAGSTITFTGITPLSPRFGSTAITYGSVVFQPATGANGTITLSDSAALLTFTNVTFGGAAQNFTDYALSGGWKITGTFTIGGQSVQGPQRVWIEGATNGVQITFNLAGSTVSVTGDVGFQDVEFSGSPTWNNAGSAFIGDGSGNGTFVTSKLTAAADQTWAGGSGNWSDKTKWTSRAPLPQDNALIPNLAAGATITGDMPRIGKNVDFTGSTGGTWTPTAASGGSSQSLFGSLTLANGMAGIGGSGATTLLLQGRGSHTITGVTNTPSTNLDVTQNGPGGTYTLQSDFVATGATRAWNVTMGTFDANGHNVTAGIVTCNAAATRSVKMGSGAWTVTGTGAVWTWTTAGLTLDPGTSTIVLSNTSTTQKTFAGAANTYNNLSITGGGTGVVNITNSSIFNVVSVGTPKTITWTSGTNNTINSLLMAGTSGSSVTFNASTPGSPATLTITGGVVCDWASITDITGAGQIPLYAGANSTLSNASNWVLQAAPVFPIVAAPDQPLTAKKLSRFPRGRRTHWIPMEQVRVPERPVRPDQAGSAKRLSRFPRGRRAHWIPMDQVRVPDQPYRQKQIRQFLVSRLPVRIRHVTEVPPAPPPIIPFPGFAYASDAIRWAAVASDSPLYSATISDTVRWVAVESDALV